MSKIIGVTVGTSTPRPDFEQKNPKKADYIKNNPLPDITEADEGKVLCASGGKFVFTDAPKAEGAAQYETVLYRHTITIGGEIEFEGGNYPTTDNTYKASFIDNNPEPYATDGSDVFSFDFSVLKGAPIIEYEGNSEKILGSYIAYVGQTDYDSFGLLKCDGSTKNVPNSYWEYGNPPVTDAVECISGEILNQPLTFTGAVEATYDGKEPVEVEIPYGFELIAEIPTTTEEVASIFINKDLNGNSFSLKQMKAIIYVPQHSQQVGYGDYRINGLSLVYAQPSNSWDNGIFEFDVTPLGNRALVTVTRYPNGTSTGTGYSNIFHLGCIYGVDKFKTIISIFFRPFNLTVPAGAWAKVYGVRA